MRNLATVAGSFRALGWRGANAFSGAGPQARFDAGRLEVDTNGVGAADFGVLLPGVAALTFGLFSGVILR